MKTLPITTSGLIKCFHTEIINFIYYWRKGWTQSILGKMKIPEPTVQSWLATLIGIYRICDEKITCWLVVTWRWGCTLYWGVGGGGGGFSFRPGPVQPSMYSALALQSAWKLSRDFYGNYKVQALRSDGNNRPAFRWNSEQRNFTFSTQPEQRRYISSVTMSE